MKTRLTKEESAHLISLGVPKEMASKSTIEGRRMDIQEVEGGFWVKRGIDYPIFTLTDLLEILPKELKLDYHDEFCIKYCKNRYCAGYGYNEPHEGFVFKEFFTTEDLIDALYELTCWCLEQRYLKIKKL